MTADPVVDGLVAGMMIWLAWRAQAGPEPFGAALCFIVLGLLTVVAWLRLGAPDVAIAEAAVGTGLTGVLLLEALAAPRMVEQGAPAGRQARRVLAVTAIAGGAVLTLILTGLPETHGLRAAVANRLPETGVSSPVTAVLLAFRAYDTLLEVGVLVLAVMAGWGLPAGGASGAREADRDPMLDAFARRIVPVGVLVAGYLWWAGTSRPGGAFQAGTVLGVAWVFLILLGLGSGPQPTRRGGRAFVIGGLALFLAIGLGGIPFADAFLAYPRDWSASLILAIEAGLSVSIASCLVALVALVMHAGARVPEERR